MSKKTTAPNPKLLRSSAEARLVNVLASEPTTRSTDELLHELQVHQIELETQNENLRQAHLVLEESRDRYLELYEFAPLGFLTLTRNGMISGVNLTGAVLLGVERKKLLHSRFANFVSPEDHERWCRYFMSVIEPSEKQNCELTFKRADGSFFQARVDALGGKSKDGSPQVCITLVDVTRSRQAEVALLHSEAMFRRLAQISPAGIFHANAQGACDYVNERWCEITGLSVKESLGDGWMRALHEEDREHTLALWQEAMSTTQSKPMEWRMQRPDGAVRWALGEAATELDERGKVAGFIGVVNDITERKQTEEELRIAAITFESQSGVMVTDSEGIILRVNQAFTQLTGYSAEEVLGKKPSVLKSGRHDQAHYQTMWEILKQKHYWQGQMWNRRKNGKVYAEWQTISAVTTPDGNITHYVSTFSEIIQNPEAEAEIYRLAYYDPLTNLPNRRMLQDRLVQAIAATTRSGNYGAILFLDLDNFKALNDTRGHDIGDQLLVEVALRLHDCVRGGDTVARLGGDEFVMLLEDLSEEAEEAAAQAKVVGEKAQDILAQPYCLKGGDYHGTTSTGISLFCGDHVTVEALLKHADLAMYQSKNAGRNTLRFFDPAMQIALEERSALEADLRLALKYKQFRLYYQPQMESALGLVGAEALLRWVHPERGLVAPGDFIPLAEETRLILPIGLWVLETACAQLKAWENSPRTCELRLAVNVSAHQFHQPDFALQVQQVLLESGANPRRLKIELTESLVLDNVADTITKMQALKAIGVGFSMDDFGTGYSSLSYLTRLPLDQLKIDQSFIRDIGTDPNGATIVQTIIIMGQTLGLNVIAEGVETEAQRDFLGSNGCHSYQGYLFSRPLPLAEFEQFMMLH